MNGPTRTCHLEDKSWLFVKAAASHAYTYMPLFILRPYTVRIRMSFAFLISWVMTLQVAISIPWNGHALALLYYPWMLHWLTITQFIITVMEATFYLKMRKKKKMGSCHFVILQLVLGRKVLSMTIDAKLCDAPVNFQRDSPGGIKNRLRYNTRKWYKYKSASYQSTKALAIKASFSPQYIYIYIYT